MIEKLKKKIFWVIQISLTSVILIVTLIYTILSYQDSINSAIIVMDRLTGDDDKKIEKLNETEILMENYDIYQFSVNNFEIFREPQNVSDEIKNYAIKVSKKTSENGVVGKYVYKVRQLGNNEKDITLMKNENIVLNIKVKIIFSISIGIISILIIYIIAKKVSKAIVQPVEEAFERQKQFISDASHELKTPLAVIKANAEVLEDKVGKNKWITYIQNEIQSMNKLVSDLLLLAKVEDKPIHNLKEIDLSNEIEMITSSFESLAYEKQINLITNIQKNIKFIGDNEDIKHILSVLIDNAIKHTTKGKKIIVELAKEKSQIKMQVKNEGEPIPKEEQSKIFERFYRVDKARNREEKRYGLGLAIAKQIVERYNGTIEVNCKDEITCFTVKFIN